MQFASGFYFVVIGFLENGNNKSEYKKLFYFWLFTQVEMTLNKTYLD